jgi:hypothetical protein
MTKQLSMSAIRDQINLLEKKMADTQYFIETASCLETKRIYQGTQIQLMKELQALYKLQENFVQNKMPDN